jgi:transmembrane sensor
VAETVGNDALLLELHTRARRRRRQRAVFVGGAVAALVLCFVMLRSPPRARSEFEPSKHLLVSLPRQQVLPDGSLAELRDGARIEIDFSGLQRRVTLLQGEAHFSVQKDPAKPFMVHAAGVEVRAVGTAFAVQMAPRGVEVLVTEGRVAVDHTAAMTTVSSNQAPLAFVAAGEGTLIEPRAAREIPPPPPRVTAIEEAEMTERLAWRVPRLELSGTPLESAVAAFNRHSKVKLVIGDPSLARLKVSGIVRADQAEALVSLLAANFDVTAEPRGSETVLLRRAR